MQHSFDDDDCFLRENQWCNQDFFQDQDQDQDLFVMHTRGRPKTFFLSFSAVNENADEKEIPFMAENENGHSFSAEKRKRKSPDNTW